MLCLLQEKTEYVTSYIGSPDSAHLLGLNADAALLLAIASSLVGFACQLWASVASTGPSPSTSWLAPWSCLSSAHGSAAGV
jgi:hypothetical protein